MRPGKPPRGLVETTASGRDAVGCSTLAEPRPAANKLADAAPETATPAPPDQLIQLDDRRVVGMTEPEKNEPVWNVAPCPGIVRTRRVVCPQPPNPSPIRRKTLGPPAPGSTFVRGHNVEVGSPGSRGCIGKASECERRNVLAKEKMKR